MKLRELFEATTIDHFDATNLDANDIIELLHLSGYTDKEQDEAIQDAEDQGLFAYAGYTDHKSHRYLYAWIDYDNAEWCVSDLYIDIGKNGKIECEFGAMPIKTFDEDDGELKKYFARVKNSKKA